MDLYGNPIQGGDLAGGGTVDGDLDVTGSLTVGAITLPLVDGNALDVLTTDGAGNTYFAPGGGGGSQTMQQTYDLSSAPQITTTIANPIFQIIGDTRIAGALDIGDYSMPLVDGSAGEAIVTDGLGNLAFAAVASGDVVGPAVSVDANIVSFDGATGKLVQDSGIGAAEVYEKKQDVDMAGNGILAVGFSENTAPLPSIAELALGEWNFDLIDSALVAELAPNQASFLSVPEYRFIASKRYIVPAAISVGGFVSWDMDFTSVSGGNYCCGISTVTDGQQFAGFGSFNSVNNSYILVQTGANVLVDRGVLGATATPNTNRISQVVRITFSRVSAVLWELSFIASAGPIAQKISYGPEDSGKFLYPLAGDLTIAANSFDVELTAFASSGYDPEQYIYTSVQDANNGLQMLDAGGQIIYKASPNDYLIGKQLITAKNIKPNQELFPDSCVRCDFLNLYKSSLVLTNSDPITNMMQPANYLRSFGSPNIPTLSPGVLYTFRVHGRLTTGALAASNVLTTTLSIGNVIVGNGIQVALVPSLNDVDFNMQWTIGASSTFFSTSSVFLDLIGGSLTYTENPTAGSQLTHSIAIQEVATVLIPEKNAGNMELFCEWSGAGSNALQVEIVEGQYTGFSL